MLIVVQGGVVMAEPESNGSQDSQSGPWEPLSRTERASAGAVGGLAGIAGAAALFITDNQAGTAAILVIAVAFLLIAIQGTPLTRFGSGEHAIELERRRLGKELVDQAESEPDLEAKEALITAAETVDPSGRWISQLEPIRYERLVYDALHRVLGENGASKIDRPAQDTGVDYVVRLSPNARIAVEAKFSRRLFSRDRITAAQNYALTTGTPVLIVTNAPLSPVVYEMNMRASTRQSDGTSPLVEVVTWNGAADDDVLHRALRRASPEKAAEVQGHERGVTALHLRNFVGEYRERPRPQRTGPF